ncbi:hypothetical protein MMC31_007811 [Peltigera leucophlebia]|nr:hypothetical protein [Peltigera leucophlebia]
MDTFLHSIEVHVMAAKLVRNRYEESLNLINREWSVDAEEYIRCKGLVGRTLQLIAGVAKQRDVSNLKTGLLLANTQAVKQIMEGKTFHLRRLFLTSQDWQQCKEDPIPSRELYVEELYNAGVHLNLGGEICAGRLLFPIPVTFNKTGPEQSGVSGKEGQCSYGETGANAPSTTITTSAHPTTSAATFPMVGHSGNTHYETTDTPLSLPFLLPKPVFGNEIPSGKAAEYASCIMPKAAFVKEVDDDDIDFEPAFCGRVCGASRFSSGDNQTKELVIDRNISATPSGQRSSVAESPKKKQLDE